jgi:transposase
MDVHKNARLTPRGRELMVKRVLEGETPKHVARSLCVCERTVRRWLARYQSEGCLWDLPIAPRARIEAHAQLPARARRES